MKTTALDFRNVNALWCSVIAETLVRCGVTRAVISPGSRSTPLTMALVRHEEIEVVPVLDERSAAFFALGLARREDRPVVLVCTSGTAGANYFPAVIEAEESGAPLLVFTADRPPEMRDCSSGQTIDQQKFYGAHVNFYHELAVPEANAAMLRYARQMVAHAVGRTLTPQRGPVHLNAPFRDPLPPLPDGTEQRAAGLVTEDFFAHLSPSRTPVFAAPELPAWPANGVVIGGSRQGPGGAAYARAVGRIGRKLGWPVLADALSPLRNRAAEVGPMVTHYDALLRAQSVAAQLRPEAVLVLEALPTSKVLREWLRSLDGVPLWFASERVVNRDAVHGAARSLEVSAETLAAALPERAEAAESDYAGRWYEANARVATAIAAEVDREETLFEGKIARVLQQTLPEGTPLFVANSMPVRDLEYFWAATDARIETFTSRGASGIDGTLSTALGIAHGAERPAVLLTGDLAFLHDTNGLLLAAKLRGSLTVVLVNNGGGGIFGHLPVAQFDPPFEEYFATPQRVDFARLVGAYGIVHAKVRDWAELRQALEKLPASGVRVLEVRTDRKADAARRKALFVAAEAAAKGRSGPA
ncbi:2-succinyl-5-enolpyruvyl-6-hydroxy-3-cyclohexene-1-carboxylic-acid synthase [Horticoccus luteus]|uniref:2-succinyl-5-enolpyruvyl-6-hydroxy-3-cyclohexene-1-carboxylate synthase n=1 Tax=Horticoccus luteus TaxID=2862869 RepID=A0A8F9TT89_9BACT|nr:2-succinyl-5-enolpyruvyl-6-hydroxy-3-cyclohexene-1-carboxylic-acid synthase [Horticoccus luteus]QYM77705.1 2-succinyl-5-enolpyruvyl-6-hydroxy-3-cyclohexene-1-carboxylic-acid synthase [Horticoccus luteus]